jgi:hypothetical protein
MRAAIAALLLATAAHAQNVTRAGPYIVESWTTTNRLANTVITEAVRFDSLPGLPHGAPAFGQPIRIILTGSDEQFRTVTGNRAPEWGIGVAVPAQGLIVLRAYGGTSGGYDQLMPVLRHELAHIALHRYLGDAYIPRWFNEGYAMWAAGELGTAEEWQLRVAFVTRSAPALDSLELGWPAMTSDARVAYILAASVVQYLVRESGPRALDVFMRTWRDTQNFETALGRTYGLSIDQLETHWRRDIRRRYGWLTVLVQSAAFASFAAVGVFAMYFVRRRRDRLKMEHLRATEPPDEPAFWTETESGEELDGDEEDRVQD